MKKSLYYIENFSIKRWTRVLAFLLVSLVVSSCEEDLPEAGSKADTTPPTSNFSAEEQSGDYLTYLFTNLSNSATDYVWDFGDVASGVNNSSTEENPSHTYPAEGTYTITLTASDKLGVESTFTSSIEVVEPDAPTVFVPTILEAGFEDLSLPDGTGDGRDSWRISGGKIFGITSSPVRTGSQGAKFDAGDPRVAYQELTVTPNADYIVTIHYTMKTSPEGGALRLAILGEAISEASEAEAAIIASTTGTDQTSASDYVEMSLEFNSGNTSTIAIWMDSNNIAEARVDDVSIIAKPE
ncbi:PKD domain-containing protein [Wenyingzhuangia aestuarii]|uniref:PKD domain-containing protein n=1 Tax=Wenyingzhuangia aestuarii TaxID=1647582 RepID=UPI001ADCB137|nr:PKD domain-containing protein [Wenyingzhuangia aestuarii]NJB82882.1 PKD repeat protein [Wenyingzhuangia aestuarii]